MTDDETTQKLVALLAWWREAGVVDSLDESPVDWTGRPSAAPGDGFAWPEPRAAPPAENGRSLPRPTIQGQSPATTARSLTPATGYRPQAPSSNANPVPTSPARAPVSRRETAGAAAAREAARSARTLEELEALLRGFEGCPLKATAKNLCFYRGSPSARIMVIGEAPGRDEDLAGKPFVGRAGQLLDRMLAAIELTEANVHIANIVYWRPPGNRVPTPEEAQACRPFLDRQIELVEPDLVLTLGGPAAKAILDVTDGIMRLRGRWREIRVGDRTVRVMPTLHPAYLLRQPEAKRQAWRDLLQLRMALDAAPSRAQ